MQKNHMMYSKLLDTKKTPNKKPLNNLKVKKRKSPSCPPSPGPLKSPGGSGGAWKKSS